MWRCWGDTDALLFGEISVTRSLRTRSLRKRRFLRVAKLTFYKPRDACFNICVTLKMWAGIFHQTLNVFHRLCNPFPHCIYRGDLL